MTHIANCPNCGQNFQSAVQIIQVPCPACKVGILNSTLHKSFMMPGFNLDRMFGDLFASPETWAKIDSLNTKFREVAEVISQHCPDSREKAQALVDLKAAHMWACDSIHQSEGLTVEEMQKRNLPVPESQSEPENA